jgi:hypothetical protein
MKVMWFCSVDLELSRPSKSNWMHHNSHISKNVDIHNGTVDSKDLKVEVSTEEKNCVFQTSPKRTVLLDGPFRHFGS